MGTRRTTRTRRSGQGLSWWAASTAMGLAAASLVVAQTPRPLAGPLTLFHGGERQEYIPPPAASGRDSITLLKGDERSEHPLHPAAATIAPVPIPSGLDPRRDCTGPGAAPAGAIGWQRCIELPPLQQADSAILPATHWTVTALPALPVPGGIGKPGAAPSKPDVRGTLAAADAAHPEPRTLAVGVVRSARTDLEASGSPVSPAAPGALPQRERQPIARPGVGQESAGSSLYRIALVYLASNLAALFTGALLFASTLFLLLRRFGPHLDALGRLDFGYGLAAGALGLTRQIAREPGAAAESNTGEEFAIGLTYEEERRLREDERQQQEEGMLRHLFEQNLKLRRQIMDHDAA